MTTFPVAVNGEVADASQYNAVTSALGAVLTVGGALNAAALAGTVPSGVGLPAALATVRGAAVLREVNVCDPAYGADPTGVADSTAAFLAAIDAAVGGPRPGQAGCPLRIIFDGVVATSGTHLTSATASFTAGETGTLVNIPGAGSFGTQYYATLTYVSATQATLSPAPSTAITSGATVVIGSQLATRTAAADIFVPMGTYKITADLPLVGVASLRFTGAGPSTILQFSGTAVKHGIYANGIADCVIGNFCLQGDGTESLTDGLSLQWTGYANDGTKNLIARTTTRVILSPLTIRGLKYVNGIAVGTASADMQVDQTLIVKPTIYAASTNGLPNAQSSTLWLTGICVGSGISGNVDIIDIQAPEIFYHTVGLKNNQAKGVSIIGGGFQNNGTSTYGNTNSYSVTQAMRAEGEGQLLGSAGGTSITSNQVIRDLDFHCNNVGAKLAEFDNPGALVLDNVRITAPGSAVPYINLQPGVGPKTQRSTGLLLGVTSAVPLPLLVRGNAQASVAALGFTQHDTSSSMVAQSQAAGLTLLGTTGLALQVDNTGSGGSGLVAYPTVSGGVLTGAVIVNGGTLYTSPPAVTYVGNNGSGVTLTAVLTGSTVTSITVNAGGTGLDALPAYGPMLAAGSLTTSSAASLIDVALYRSAASQWQMVGNLAIGYDGLATRTLQVYGATLGASLAMQGNDIIFSRTGGPSNISQSGGQALIFKTTDNVSALQNRVTIGGGAAGVAMTLTNCSLSVPNSSVSAATYLQPGSGGSGAHLWSGTGAPTTPGGSNPTAGDLYVRSDGTAGSWLYRCTTGGASPVWAAML